MTGPEEHIEGREVEQAPSPKPVKKPKPRAALWIAGGVLAALAGAGVAYFAPHIGEDQELTQSMEEAAAALAAQRNTCELGKLVLDLTDRPELDVTITLKTATKPETSNEAYDGLLEDVDFKDAPGNLINLLAVVNEDTGKSVGFASDADPDGPGDSGTIPLQRALDYKLLHAGKNLLSVWRVNSVQADISGLLIDDLHTIGTGQVACAQNIAVFVPPSLTLEPLGPQPTPGPAPV